MRIIRLILIGFVLSIIFMIFVGNTSYSTVYVCIDPGHGGSDNGATGRVYGVKEKDANLWVGLALKDSLQYSGYPEFVAIPLMTNEDNKVD